MLLLGLLDFAVAINMADQPAQASEGEPTECTFFFNFKIS